MNAIAIKMRPGGFDINEGESRISARNFHTIFRLRLENELAFLVQCLGELKFSESCVEPALREQRFVRALFNHCTVLKHDDVISLHHGRKAVGNRE